MEGLKQFFYIFLNIFKTIFLNILSAEKSILFFIINPNIFINYYKKVCMSKIKETYL